MRLAYKMPYIKENCLQNTHTLVKTAYKNVLFRINPQ